MSKKEIQQSVTNAILDQKLQTLTGEVSKLATSVSEGFKGIHERQDTTNGKVLKAGQDIITNRGETDTKFVSIMATFKYNRFIWYVLTVCVSVIISLASYILFKH